MSKDIFPQTTPAIAASCNERVFAAGALRIKLKQPIAVAAARVTQCLHCIRGHSKAALRQGATVQEIMEAIWVAAEMRAGGSYAHALALDTIDQVAKAAGRLTLMTALANIEVRSWRLALHFKDHSKNCHRLLSTN